jgi:PAS domain S-box-containing protein
MLIVKEASLPHEKGTAMITATTSVLTTAQKNHIFENMSDAIMTIGIDEKISYMSSTCAQLFQIDKELALGEHVDCLLLLHKKNRILRRFFFELIHSEPNPELYKKLTKQEFSYWQMDGTKKYLEIRVTPLFNDDTQAERNGFLFQIVDITDRKRLKQHEHDCAHIFAGLIICISLYLFTWSLLRFTLRIYLKTSSYTLMIEGISILLFFDVLLFTSITLRDLGIIPNWKKFGQNIISSTLLAVMLCGALVIGKVILQLLGIEIKKYFIGGSVNGALFYIITALIQEFLARGVIQTCVKSLMHVKYQKQFGIVLTSLLFSLMHLPFGFLFMMGAFVLSLILGAIYENQGDFWGCVLLHWSVGYVSMSLFF